MRVIQKQQNHDGSYRQIFELDCTTAPDGCYQVANGVELSCGGFGELTIEDNIVAAFTPDTAAWERWQAEHPAPEPKLDDITALQLAVTELAESQVADQTANELALAELAEIMTGGLT